MRRSFLVCSSASASGSYPGAITTSVKMGLIDWAAASVMMRFAAITPP